MNPPADRTLAERLGYDADAPLLIVNCDDLGMCHSANEGVYHSLRSGFATSATLMVVVGAIVGSLYDKRAERTANPESTKQLGVLLASGMIVGEGLVGVVIAGIVAFNLFPLALVGDEFAGPAKWIGGIAFVVVIVALYRSRAA